MTPNSLLNTILIESDSFDLCDTQEFIYNGYNFAVKTNSNKLEIICNNIKK